MKLAEHPKGLPLGFITRPFQYADMSSLFERRLWTSFSRASKISHDLHIQAFIIFSIFLCLLCTLMGPATAVMAIPTLQWRNTETIVHGAFKGLTSQSPPGPSSSYIKQTLRECHMSHYQNARFSCTRNYRGWALDGWLGSVIHTRGGNTHIQSEEWVAFAINGSVSGANKIDTEPVWIPNRNFLWEYSNLDFRATRAILTGAKYNELSNHTGLTRALTESQYASYAIYNRSLQVEILRQGPIVGTSISLWYTNQAVHRSITTAKLDNTRSIKCYQRYQFAITYRPAHDHDLFYTKCIQLGTGWGNNTSSAKFNVNATSDAASSNRTITVNVFSSDQVAYLPHGVLPAAVPEACISNGRVPSGVHCDELFNSTGDPTIANRTRYVTTMEMTMKSPDKKDCILTVDHVAYLGFSTYSLDLSPITNPTYQVQALNTPLLGQPQPVHPHWTLAAWSVDNNGFLATDRTLTALLSDLMLSWANGKKTEPAPMRTGVDRQVALTTLVFVPIFHTMSMLGLNVRNKASAADDPAHILSRYARRYVWSYGMFSTSARLSAAVMICGVLVVIAQFILGLLDPRHSMNLTELLESALAYQPGQSTDNGSRSQDEIVRGRIRITPSHSSGVLVDFQDAQH